jgi:LPXTG-site transpeptidase (sortase) family protein
VTVLKLDLNVPSGHDCLLFDVQFMSEEYPEYVGNVYDDAFLAELDGNSWSVSGTTITAPLNFALAPGNKVMSINSGLDWSESRAAGTGFDNTGIDGNDGGGTDRYPITTPITPGAHSLYLTVFDMSDEGLDTAVFLDNMFTADTAGTCTAGVVTTDTIPPTAPVSMPANGAFLTTGPTQIEVTYSEDVNHVSPVDQGSATNVANYILVEDGANPVFNTIDCASGAAVGDTSIAINGITYNAGTFTATLSINGGVPLPQGVYRLYVCGTTSIEDPTGNVLNGGLSDTQFNFTVGSAATIPDTGFAPGRVTALPEPAVSYTRSDLWLEIPRLGVQMDIVGVPQVNGEWDVTWLGKQAGWLEGSAFPTWEGNSVLTGHVWNADNTAGPFRYLNTLWYGDTVVVHAGGAEYVYAVRSVLQVGPGSTAQLLKHEELPWVTLVTCRGYDPVTGEYRYRLLVRAVLVEVK